MLKYDGPLQIYAEAVAGLNQRARVTDQMPHGFFYEHANNGRLVRAFKDIHQSLRREVAPSERVWQAKVGSNNQLWRSRHQHNKIVCSEYMRYRIVGRCESFKKGEPQLIATFSGPYGFAYFPGIITKVHTKTRPFLNGPLSSDYKTFDLSTHIPWNGSVYHYRSDLKRLSANDFRGSKNGSNGSLYYEPLTPVLPPALTSLPFSPINAEPVPPERILYVSNKLKESEVDIITELAELHATVEGLASNVYRVAQYMRDLKSFTSRKKALHTVKYAIDVDQPISFKSLKNYRRDVRREERRLQKFQKRMNHRYGSAGSPKAIDRLASHWLDSQYGIGPVLILIEEQLRNLSEHKRVYLRASTRWTEEVHVVLPEGATLIQNNLVWKRTVWAKAKLSYETLYDQLRSYYHGNLLNTAWEKLPFSFVYDWVINLGDVLQSIDFDAQHVQTVFMNGSLMSGELIYEIEDQESGTTTRYAFRGFGYQRRFVNPDDRYLSLAHPIDFGMSLKRKISAMALSWHAFRGNKLQRTLK